MCCGHGSPAELGLEGRSRGLDHVFWTAWDESELYVWWTEARLGEMLLAGYCCLYLSLPGRAVSDRLGLEGKSSVGAVAVVRIMSIVFKLISQPGCCASVD